SCRRVRAFGGAENHFANEWSPRCGKPRHTCYAAALSRLGASSSWTRKWTSLLQPETEEFRKTKTVVTRVQILCSKRIVRKPTFALELGEAGLDGGLDDGALSVPGVMVPPKPIRRNAWSRSFSTRIRSSCSMVSCSSYCALMYWYSRSLLSSCAT